MATTVNGTSELRALADVLKSNIDQLLETIESRGQVYPSLNEPWTPESEAPRTAPDVLALGDIIVSAAAQLIATVRPTPTTPLITALQFQVSSCLRAAIRTHVPEILREAGPEGLHVSKIADYTQVDPSKLARILRLLATHHIFKETAPDVFTHNRLSTVLDTGKSVEEVLADPIGKHDGSSGVPALIEQLTDYSMKAASYMPETLLDPSIRGTTKTAFNRAYQTELSSFEWITAPENAAINRRFNMAMEGTAKMSQPGEVFEGFDWNALPEGSLVVDVGGGVGSQTLTLAKKFPHLNFVIQDTEATRPNAIKYWEARYPDAIASGRVQYQPHSFFDPQPISSPAVFFLRQVLHDWSDAHSVSILRQLRDSAGPDTKLIIAENIMEYACEESSLTNLGVNVSSATKTHPAPLLPNSGAASMYTYYIDFVMMNTHGGIERTLPHWIELLADGGWKVISMYKSIPGARGKVIAVPQKVGVQTVGAQ